MARHNGVAPALIALLDKRRRAAMGQQHLGNGQIPRVLRRSAAGSIRHDRTYGSGQGRVGAVPRGGPTVPGR